MLRQERDYILRLINQASVALARLRERVLAGAKPDDIVEATRAAQGELLGRDAAMLRILDAKSAAHAIGDKDVLAMWSELLLVEAEALRNSGKTAEADALTRRAHDLRL